MSQRTIAVVGLGYVGLPLAVEFGKKFTPGGYDLSERKVASYRKGCDPSGDASGADFSAAKYLLFSTDSSRLSKTDCIIVAVPNPIDAVHHPEFSFLVSASTTVGQQLKRGAIVIYESAIYPGATEEVCIPILERESGLKWMKDFHVGYSPERVKPGDKERTITKVVKVISGDDAETFKMVAELYEHIIIAREHKVSSIKIAEAAKVIENSQLNLKIALMNESAQPSSRRRIARITHKPL